MADTRQIIFSNFISPQIGTTVAATTQALQEYSVGNASYVKWQIDTGTNKTLGGKGIAETNYAQWGNGWYSGWSNLDTWDINDSVWSTNRSSWGGSETISSGGSALSDSSDDCIFLYIKNIGSYDAKISIKGVYSMLLSPGMATVMRPEGTECDEIVVAAVSTDTKIEFIIAK